MTVSDALPVQFWLADCETYNEHVPQGVHQVCWCQPWNCDDEIVIQFTDPDVLDLSLIVNSSEGEVLVQLPLPGILRNGVYVYQTTFIPSDHDICDQTIRLFAGGFQNIIDSDEDSFSGWSQTLAGNEVWRVPEYTIRTKAYKSPTLGSPIPTATEVTFIITRATDPFIGAQVTVRLSQSAGAASQSVNIDMSAEQGSGVINTTAAYDIVEILAEVTYQNFKIVDFVALTANEIVIDNNTFNSTLSPWTSVQVNPTDFPWEWQGTVGGDGHATSLLLTGIDDDADRISEELTVTMDDDITDTGLIKIDITYRILFIGNVNDQNFRFEIYVGGELQTTIVLSDYLFPGVTVTVSEFFTATETSDELAIVFKANSDLRIMVDEVNVSSTVIYTIPVFSLWSNVGFGLPWSEASGDIQITVPATSFSVYFYEPGDSNTIKHTVNIPAGEAYSYFIQVHSPTATPNISLSIKFNGVTCGIETITESITVQNDVYTFAGSFSSSQAITNISIEAEHLGTGEAHLIVDKFAITAVLDSIKSDCLDVQESHDETILISYSNNRNFDGLVYPEESPDLAFNIRVPCRFFHEVEPEEDEAMELTSSILTTSAQVKTQRLLEVKHSPYYFHKKLRRILKHQNVTIFDKPWKKEEKYEVNEGRKTWPLKSATCLLTEKNSVVRNVL